MRVAFFSTRSHDRTWFTTANQEHHHHLTFFEAPLHERTAKLAEGHTGVCAFVNDQLDSPTLHQLHALGIRLVALRAAGFNSVDLHVADELGITVLRVPSYSPHAVAEHTVGLMLTLNRKLHRSIPRVRDQNFSLDGLLGFDMAGRTVGVVGTGQIGALVAKIMRGFGCRIVAMDVHPNPRCVELGVEYVHLDALFNRSDIITLHAPLTPQTRHMINDRAVQQMKPSAMLINTSRGALIDTSAVIRGLKSGKIGYLGLDVYEEEADLFFKDLSDQVIKDDVFARLLTFPNVVVTAHQAFFTADALNSIARTTLQNVTDFERGTVREENRVTGRRVTGRIA